MRRCKKGLPFLISAVLCLACFNVKGGSVLPDKFSAAAAETLSSGYLDYEIQDGSAVICGLNKETADIVIPSEIDGIPVKKLKRFSFAEKVSIKNVKLPDSLEIIESFAFENCTGLTEIYIPDSVTKIEDHVFSGCTDLKKVRWPDSVKYFDNYVLMNTAIEEINIPDGTQYLTTQCFQGTKLKHVVLPKSVISIGIGAFENCGDLESINLENVSSIDGGAFNYCVKLKEVNLSPKMKRFKGAFIGCSSIKKLIIPEGVTEISAIGCENLEYLYVPSTVRRLYRGTFSELKNLKEITLPDRYTQKYEEFQDSMFSGCSSLKGFIYPFGTGEIRDNTFGECTDLEYVFIPDDVTSIGSHAFASCPSLSVVFIPDSVSEIKENAFGYYYDDKGNLAETEQDIVFVTQSDNSCAAQYAAEKGYTVLNINTLEAYDYFKPGDINLDKKINADDALLLQEYLSAQIEFMPIQAELADVNGDGKTDVFDMIALKRILLK